MKKDRSQVARYAHFEELVSCLESGWSPAKVHEFLVLRHGTAPEEWTIRRWRDAHIPEAKVLPPRVMQEKLKGLDYKVDALGNLSRLVVMLEDRFARWYEQEMTMGMVLPANDGTVRVYLEALRDYVSVAQDLGIMKAPPAPVIDMRTQNLNVFPPEIAASLVETAKLLASLGMLPVGGQVGKEVDERKTKKT